MKKFRTVAAVVIMFFAAMAGYFVGAALQEEMGGAILFAVSIGRYCRYIILDWRKSRGIIKATNTQGWCI